MIKLTKEQLKQLLADNEKMLKKAIKEQNIEAMSRLMTHRAIVKDMIIEALEFELQLQAYYSKVA